VCLCEGVKGDSIDGIFINKLIKSLDPSWLRPWGGSNILRLEQCGGRAAVIKKMPVELRNCQAAGGNTTLMVWADCDDDKADGDELKADFWQEAQRNGISKGDFDLVVFIFAKDRLENWIEFLRTGSTDESKEGPRIRYNSAVAEAAKKLADWCKAGKSVDGMPPSLQWSCKNWRALKDRMKT
jgi:hypothetical protein